MANDFLTDADDANETHTHRAHDDDVVNCDPLVAKANGPKWGGVDLCEGVDVSTELRHFLHLLPVTINNCP